MADYGQLVFIYDKEGNEYACPIDALKSNIKDGRELSEEERKECLNMAEIVGTERI